MPSASSHPIFKPRSSISQTYQNELAPLLHAWNGPFSLLPNLETHGTLTSHNLGNDLDSFIYFTNSLWVFLPPVAVGNRAAALITSAWKDSWLYTVAVLELRIEVSQQESVRTFTSSPNKPIHEAWGPHSKPPQRWRPRSPARLGTLLYPGTGTMVKEYVINKLLTVILFHLEKNSGCCRADETRTRLGSPSRIIRPHWRKSDQTMGGFWIAAFIPLRCVQAQKEFIKIEKRKKKKTFARIF